MSCSVLENHDDSTSTGNDGGRVILTHIQAHPSPILSETLLRAAVTLKDMVVRETWRRTSDPATRGIDPTAYTGLLGTAITCLRSFRAIGDRRELILASEIVDACVAALDGAPTRWSAETPP